MDLPVLGLYEMSSGIPLKNHSQQKDEQLPPKSLVSLTRVVEVIRTAPMMGPPLSQDPIE